MGEQSASEAVVEITQLRARYSWAYDEADLDAMMRLFIPDAAVDLGEWGVWRGIDEIRAGYEGQMARHSTMHSVGTMVVDVDGDRASARMYVTVFHPPRADDHPIRFVGRYFDEYQRHRDGWRIASIRLEQLWFAGY